MACRILKDLSLLKRPLLKQVVGEAGSHTRRLWGYVAIAFNRVDVDRLQLVGPDRLCAEWLIKNGGAVRTVGTANLLWNDYNSLPSESQRFKIKVVDASGSSIMKIGLEHFRGCDQIDTVILHQCKHLESDGLHGLLYLKNSLKMLQISECDNIKEDGLAVVKELHKLELLRLFNMRYIKNLQDVSTKIKEALPNCHVETNG